MQGGLLCRKIVIVEVIMATYIASNAELLTEQNYTDIDALVFAEIIHRGGTDEEGEVFTNKYLTAGVRQ